MQLQIKMLLVGIFRLNFGLISVTMFVSMWISNTAAVAMMIPIMQAVLEELEAVRLIDNSKYFILNSHILVLFCSKDSAKCTMTMINMLKKREC